ncbi:hypothetical protein ES703_69101 [subsurface metagenome]
MDSIRFLCRGRHVFRIVLSFSRKASTTDIYYDYNGAAKVKLNRSEWQDPARFRDRTQGRIIRTELMLVRVELETKQLGTVLKARGVAILRDCVGKC